MRGGEPHIGEEHVRLHLERTQGHHVSDAGAQVVETAHRHGNLAELVFLLMGFAGSQQRILCPSRVPGDALFAVGVASQQLAHALLVLAGGSWRTTLQAGNSK